MSFRQVAFFCGVVLAAPVIVATQNVWQPGISLVQTSSELTSSKASLSAPAEKDPHDLASLVEEIAALKKQLESFMGSFEDKIGACCSRNSSCKPETDTQIAREPRPMLCAAFGDPHYITFDGAQTTFVGDMIQWMVKSTKVWLQALSRGSEGKMIGLAVGGPFMNGHKLVVHNASAGEALRVLFDGQPILEGGNSEFSEQGILKAYRRQEWDGSVFNNNVLDIRTKMKFDIDDGTFASRFLNLPKFGVYMFQLPGGVEITVSGVDFMSTVVSMEAQEGGQSGYCGNFDGNPDDDAEPVAPSWDKAVGKDLDPVAKDMVLFPKDIVAALLGFSASSNASDAPASSVEARLMSVSKCSAELLEKAETACTAMKAVFHKFCIFDVCLTGDISVAGSARAAEMMQQKVNARGVPIFMGHGKCVDASGQQYQAYSTKLRSDNGCQQLLRALSVTRGVVGAEMRRGGYCDVLVTGGSDPTSTAIPGGWGAPTTLWKGDLAKKIVDSFLPFLPAAARSELAESQQSEPNAAKLGTGSIMDIKPDAAWNCWQLD